MPYSDVVIDVFGEIGDVADLVNLARAASAEGGVDWSIEATTEEVVDYVLDMADAALPVTLVANDVRSSEDAMFPQVRRLARAAGLSYVVVHGAAGDEGYESGFSWKPGLVQEVRFDLDGASEPSVSLSQLKESLAAGPDAVGALVAATEAKAAVGSIAVHPNVVEAVRGNVPAL